MYESWKPCAFPKNLCMNSEHEAGFEDEGVRPLS